MDSINKIIKFLFCLPIKGYQYFISPFIAASCRFYPSCSHYAVTAIHYYGPLKGCWKSIKRLLRCHPWSKGGYDPVFPNEEIF